MEGSDSSLWGIKMKLLKENSSMVWSNLYLQSLNSSWNKFPLIIIRFALNFLKPLLYSKKSLPYVLTLAQLSPSPRPSRSYRENFKALITSTWHSSFHQDLLLVIYILTTLLTQMTMCYEIQVGFAKSS